MFTCDLQVSVFEVNFGFVNPALPKFLTLHEKNGSGIQTQQPSEKSILL